MPPTPRGATPKMGQKMKTEAQMHAPGMVTNMGGAANAKLMNMGGKMQAPSPSMMQGPSVQNQASMNAAMAKKGDVAADKRMPAKAEPVQRGKMGNEPTPTFNYDSPLTIDSLPVQASLGSGAMHNRYLGAEIQGLMYAFGEVRYCGREVLELMEDAVREATRNALFAAAEISERSGRTSEDGNAIVNADVIAHLYRKSPPVLHRLNEALELAQSLTSAQQMQQRKQQRQQSQDQGQSQPQAPGKPAQSSEPGQKPQQSNVPHQNSVAQARQPKAPDGKETSQNAGQPPMQGNRPPVQRSMTRKRLRAAPTTVDYARSLGYFSDDEPSSPSTSSAQRQQPHATAVRRDGPEMNSSANMKQLQMQHQQQQMMLKKQRQPPPGNQNATAQQLLQQQQQNMRLQMQAQQQQLQQQQQQQQHQQKLVQQRTAQQQQQQMGGQTQAGPPFPQQAHQQKQFPPHMQQANRNAQQRPMQQQQQQQQQAQRPMNQQQAQAAQLKQQQQKTAMQRRQQDMMMQKQMQKSQVQQPPSAASLQAQPPKPPFQQNYAHDQQAHAQVQQNGHVPDQLKGGQAGAKERASSGGNSGGGPAQTKPPLLIDDVAAACSWRAAYALRQCMPGYQEFVKFQDKATFIRGHTNSRNGQNVTAVPKVQIFKAWLNLTGKDGIALQEDAIVALNHIAWEATGLITQTALMLRHFESMEEGLVDPRAQYWSYGRHVLSALGPGVATGVVIDLTDAQLVELKQEIEAIESISQLGGGYQKWRGYKKQGLTQCLLPQHIKEAVRRLDRPPGVTAYALSSVTAGMITGRILT